MDKAVEEELERLSFSFSLIPASSSSDYSLSPRSQIVQQNIYGGKDNQGDQSGKGKTAHNGSGHGIIRGAIPPDPDVG